MATLNVLVGFKKETVKLTPMQPLSTIVTEICGRSKGKLDPERCTLKINGKVTLELSTPFRLANLPSSAKLELVHEPLATPAAAPTAAPVPQAASASPTPVQQQLAPPPPQAPAVVAAAAAPTPRPPRPIQPPPVITEGVWPAPFKFPESSTPAAPTTSAPRASSATAAAAVIDTTEAMEADESLTPLERELGRPLRVVLPEQSSDPEAETVPMDVSDDFYEFTAEDFARMEKAKKRHADMQADSKQMKTSKMREKERRAAEAAALAAPVVLRVRFADLAEVEAPFRGKDTLGSLHHFIRSCLAPTPTPSAGAATLVLFTTPPRLNLADDATTLAAAGLAPAALVHCALDGREWLRADVRALAGRRSETLYTGGAAEAAAAAAAAARSGGGRDAQTKAKAEALAGLHAGATGEGLDTSGGAVGSGSKAGKPKWLKL